jgi:hypothetical protein
MSKFFARALRAFKRYGSSDVTLGTLTLGSRVATGSGVYTTGWRAVTYPTSTIPMIIVLRGSTFSFEKVGLYASEDVLGLTDSTVKLGDQIKSSDNRYFMIKGLEKYYRLNSFLFWKATMSELPLWQAAPGALTWTLTRSKDPRERSKTYIDTYVRDAQLTKDDDSTQAAWACIFSEPPYPVAQEFRAASNPVFGLYVVEIPNSTPGLDTDQIASEYEEHVPIHIITVDSTACTGTALNWKMEEELRYVCETYPEGSFRSLERRSKRTVNLPGLILYDSEFMMNYVRNVTT